MDIKILIADDNEETLGALSRLLANYDLVAASDGKSARELAASERPDLVLLDVEMPGLNGIDVLKGMLSLPRKPLVIMITADGSRETIEKALSLGVFAYITKPFEKDDILGQVGRAITFIENRGGD
ncbi:MAG TPA: hypothetical protein DCW72_04700 [Elusimicrobia bacterium]|nr:MAG: hypothetical protein A2X29_09275 [Elusimicrobia bacterium GWA2_64_40]OGR67744.1 MAG: hypothetical protein A2X30_09485 [Elusimicrobia bacterium GWB2_63_16]HAN04029.1 hypothetical protein [Elusimicrobiota bacterium]HAU89542.1 hypothetical protein [Elusimicrobiota bacterium]